MMCVPVSICIAVDAALYLCETQMMQPGPFNTFIAENCDVDEKTVTVFTRELKEAHLITSGGRGRYAPHMLPIDAARVLIALMATDRPSEAVPAIVRWSNMRVREADGLDDLDQPIFMGNPTLEQALIRIIALDPDPANIPASFPAFQIARNEKTAFLEWHMNAPPRAVFGDPGPMSVEERRELRGIRRMCLVSPACLSRIATGMWADRFEGSDDDGHSLDLRHPWNLEGGPAEVAARRNAIYDYVRRRDADWLKGA